MKSMSGKEDISCSGNCGQCDAGCIDDVPFLSSIPDREKKNMVSRSVRKKVKKGGYLFREGQVVDSIYIILSGKVKLTRYDADGREQIVGIFSDGDAIWEGLLADEPYFPYSGKCLIGSTVCIIQKEDFLDVLKDPQVSYAIITMLSEKLHNANERNMYLSRRDPKERLAGFLIYRESMDRSNYIEIKLDDIAASVCLRPETVSRKISELVDEGTIERIGKSGIHIVDAGRLREIFE